MDRFGKQAMFDECVFTCSVCEDDRHFDRFKSSVYL